GQSNRDGRVAADQAWDPLEASQYKRGESATKATQYTRARVLHWEIMGLRAAIALLMLVGAALATFVGWQVLTPAPALERGTAIVEIRAHDSVLSIARRLYQAGGIRTRTGFVFLAVARGTSTRLKAGEYELERGASTVAVLAQLEAGRVKQHVVLH